MTIDFNLAKIYKICRKDGNLKNMYIGSSCKLHERTLNHKSICNNANTRSYNLKVYKHIRLNGGWISWHVVLLEDYPCLTKKELISREGHWVRTFEPTLNTEIPGRSDSQSARNWSINNPSKVIQYCKNRKLPMTCECGSIFQKTQRARHKRSKKHLNLMKMKSWY